jgi:hypothetical protein
VPPSQRKLRDDRPREADEEVVEAAVLEVVLDPGASDPADPPVDHEQLAMVDVAERAEVPTDVAVGAERAERRPCLRRPDDADVDAGCGQALVELPRSSLRVRPLPVDDEAHDDALARLRRERLRERFADDARSEPELVDVDRRGRRRQVVEHSRVEGAPFDEDLDVGGAALGEPEREPRPRDRLRHEPLRVLADPVVGHGNRSGGVRLPLDPVHVDLLTPDAATRSPTSRRSPWPFRR